VGAYTDDAKRQKRKKGDFMLKPSKKVIEKTDTELLEMLKKDWYLSLVKKYDTETKKEFRGLPESEMERAVKLLKENK